MTIVGSTGANIHIPKMWKTKQEKMDYIRNIMKSRGYKFVMIARDSNLEPVYVKTYKQVDRVMTDHPRTYFAVKELK